MDVVIALTMPTRQRHLSRCLTGLFLLKQCFDVSAWGVAGHERLNRIAQSLLHGKHTDQIRTMMHSDVIDVASWEKEMTKQYPETELLHWHSQVPEWTCDAKGVEKTEHLRCDGKGAEESSLFCAAAFFFEHFADDVLLKEYPTPKTPIDTPKEIRLLKQVNMEKLPNLEGKKRRNIKPAFYLRWLTGLIGDLHQPLHWLKDKDYGREVNVVYKNELYSLLDFWEDFLPKNLPEPPSVSKLDLEYKAQYHDWGNRPPPELFREWAGEMSSKVCAEIYGPMYVNHADGSRTIEKPFNITEDVFLKWQTLASQVIQEGGERLALVYLDIIEHRRHKAAQKEGRGLMPPLLAAAIPASSGVDKTVFSGQASAKHSVPAPAEEKAKKGSALSSQLHLLSGLHRARRRRAWKNFGINTLIAAVLVPALLFGLTTHSRVGFRFGRAFAAKNNA